MKAADFKDVWMDRPGDPLDSVPVPDTSATKQDRKRKERKPKGQDFLYEDMPNVVLGLDAAGIVWVLVLQKWRMENFAEISLTNVRLEQFGVDRFAKYRALRRLEKLGLIRVDRADYRNPLVTVVREKIAK
jgi:hypothetical protein